MSYLPVGARAAAPSAATHVWCPKVGNVAAHWRRKRADGKNPCAVVSTGKWTPSTSPSSQCRDAGVSVSRRPGCVADLKRGLSLAAAVKRAGAPAIVREGRKSVIFPLCRQAGVPEDMLQQCYDEIRKGSTPEEQAAILEGIAQQVAEQTAEMGPGAGMPGAPRKGLPIGLLLAGGGALVLLVVLLKRRKK